MYIDPRTNDAVARWSIAAVINSLKSLGLGGINGMIMVVSTLPLGLLIFPGSLAKYAQYGTTLALLSSALSCILLAITSQFKNTVSMAQDTSAVVLLLANVAIAQKIAAEVPTASPLATILVGIALSGVIVGILLYLLGQFHLGNLFRYIPYTVIGGFLAGTGWFILVGSWSVLTETAFNVNQLPLLFNMPLLLQWLPGIVFGVILYLISRLVKQQQYIYVFFFLVVALFYGVLWLNDISLVQAHLDGLLFSAASPVKITELYQQFDFGAVHWSVLLSQWWYLILLALLTPIGLLLNASSIEILSKKNVDFNYELKITGLANTVSSAVGAGIIGYHAVSLSALNQRLSDDTRIIGVTAGLVCLLTLFSGIFLFNYLPRFPFAGFLVFLGLHFLITWLYDIWFRLNIWDCLIITTIFVVILINGFLSGIFVGVLIASVIFALNYSQVKVIKSALSGSVRRSNVDREEHLKAILYKNGDAIYIIQLQSYLFFGNTNHAMISIMSRLNNLQLTPVQYLVIDFRDVPAIDSSSVLCFLKLANVTQLSGIDIIFTGVPAHIKTTLSQELPMDGRIHFFDDLDHGLEWCEDDLLRKTAPTSSESSSLKKSLLPFAHQADDVNHLLNALDSMSVPEHHYLISQGDAPTNMYFIESGIVEVFLVGANGTMMRLRTMSSGTIIGEMGLYLNRPRTATVITKVPCQLYHLSLEKLVELEIKQPALASLLHRYIASQTMLRLNYANELIYALLYGK